MICKIEGSITPTKIIFDGGRIVFKSYPGTLSSLGNAEMLCSEEQLILTTNFTLEMMPLAVSSCGSP